MRRRSTSTSTLLIGTAMAMTALGLGGVALATGGGPDTTAQVTAQDAAHSGHAMAAPLYASGDDPDGDGYIMANPPVTGVTPSDADPPHRYFHEFQANCSFTHSAPDDPIVYPGQPGASHNHTFMGNTTTAADSTTASLGAGESACKAPDDLSAYWVPTVYNGDQPVYPVGPQTIYYKAGVTDYTSVRPFPKGLRFVVGSPMQTEDQFRGLKGWVEGWECGDDYGNSEIPVSCPNTPDVQLNIRLQAPSCWDGIHLDTPDHKSHMAYPVVKPGTNDNVCPADHPVAVPMVEFKMAFPVNGDMSKVRLASGAGHTYHYDFFNAWDDPTLKALVDHCIVGGLQCDARGYDQTNPQAGAALGEDYRLH